MTKIGRPTSYTQEIADAVCEWIAEGKPLCDFCKQDGMPAFSTISRWQDDNEPFRNAYMRARGHSADKDFDEIISIADDHTIDPNSRRVMIEARKFVVGKKKPQSYGDKLDLNVTGTMDVRAMTDDQIKAKLTAKLNAILPDKS